MQHAKPTDSNAQQLRGLAEQLNWSSVQTTTDMSYQAWEVSMPVKMQK